MKNKRILVFLILVLAFVLRFWEFGKIPAGIYVDEASHGVNAYSILKTGKDEYGKQFPVLIRSFGTYASALYTYLTTIPVFFLGLNEFSIRLISLISGMVLLGAVIWQFGLLVGLIVAISPIFVLISRAAYEPNLGLALVILGSVLAFKAFKNPKLLLIAFPIISLSAYGYHAERFIGAVVVLFFSFKHWNKKSKTIILISLFLFLIIQMPIFSVSLTKGAYARLSGLGVEGTISQRIMSFSRLYLEYLSPDNLFSKPDPDKQRSFVDLSVFYWWMFIPFIFGIFAFIKEKKWQEITGQYFLMLLIFSPILGALTKDYFSTLRALPLFLGISWLTALGLRKLIKPKFMYLLLVVISLFELYPNLVLLKYERSEAWNYEYRKLFEILNNFKNQNIVIESGKSQPVYILDALYNKTEPQILQKRFSDYQLDNYYSQTNFDNNFRIENIEYRPISWKEDPYEEQILVADLLAVSNGQVNEHKFEVLYEITDIDNKVVLRIYKTHPQEKCQHASLSKEVFEEKCSQILLDKSN